MSYDPNVLHTSVEKVELAASILEIHHTMHSVLDDVEDGRIPTLLIGALAEEIGRRLGCDIAPRLACHLVDAVLQAAIEAGILTVADSRGMPIIAAADVPS